MISPRGVPRRAAGCDIWDCLRQRERRGLLQPRARPSCAPRSRAPPARRSARLSARWPDSRSERRMPQIDAALEQSHREREVAREMLEPRNDEQRLRGLGASKGIVQAGPVRAPGPLKLDELRNRSVTVCAAKPGNVAALRVDTQAPGAFASGADTKIPNCLLHGRKIP